MKEERPLVWRANNDQIAHAHRLAAGVTRTLCGKAIVLHRFAWPPLMKCPDCLSISGVKVVT